MISKMILFKVINRLKTYTAKIRGGYYRLFFKKCGASLYVRGKVFLHYPQNICVGKNVTIGPYCRIETTESTNSSIKPLLEIGDGCSIEHSVHIYCASELKIGDDCMFASGSLVTDNNHGTNPIIGKYSSQQLTSKSTIIQNNVWLGEHVCVLAGSFIGSNSIIGANSVVTNIIPANSIAVGIPAKVVKKFNFDTNEWVAYNGKN